MASIKSQIKNATKATKTNVDTDYRSGQYAAANRKVDATTNTNISNATTQAESAYQQAATNNRNRAAQSNKQNTTVTRQVGRGMKRAGFSMTNRNVAGAASARSASTINTAKTNADRNAQLTRDTSTSKAKQSAYEMAAKNKAANTKADIQRSTQQSKVKAQRAFQSAEAQKSRDLTNAYAKREEKLDKKKRKYERKQRKLKAYTSTIATRYQSVKSVDKAISKMKKNKKASNRRTKIAYLQALRAQLKAANKTSGGSSSGGRRGGRRYGGRRYGSSRYRRSSSSGSSNGRNLSLDGNGGNGGNGGGNNNRARNNATSAASEIGAAGAYIGAAAALNARVPKNKRNKK